MLALDKSRPRWLLSIHTIDYFLCFEHTCSGRAQKDWIARSNRITSPFPRQAVALTRINFRHMLTEAEELNV